MLYFLSLLDSEEEKYIFETIYKEYRSLMYFVANDIIHDEKESEDIVHDSFLKLIKILDKISNPVCPKTRNLVITIVERAAIDVYRSRKRHMNQELNEEVINVPSEDEIQKREKANKIQRAIALLPTKYREIILLKYDNELSNQEISDIMDMNEENVKKTIQRAKKKLACILEEI